MEGIEKAYEKEGNMTRNQEMDQIINYEARSS